MPAAKGSARTPLGPISIEVTENIRITTSDPVTELPNVPNVPSILNWKLQMFLKVLKVLHALTGIKDGETMSQSFPLKIYIIKMSIVYEHK